jgi:hypothetical protein
MKDVSKNSSELSERHIAQIIRRNMIQKVKPSGKTYKRKKFSKKDLES